MDLPTETAMEYSEIDWENENRSYGSKWLFSSYVVGYLKPVSPSAEGGAG